MFREEVTVTVFKTAMNMKSSRKRVIFSREAAAENLKYKTGCGDHCSVRGCHNNQKRLYMWSIVECFDHRPMLQGECSCEPPYRLFRPKTDVERREWLSTLRLKKPPKNLFVCSFHFFERQPTLQNPVPQLFLGYESNPKLGRKPPANRTRHQTVQLAVEEPEQGLFDYLHMTVFLFFFILPPH